MDKYSFTLITDRKTKKIEWHKDLGEMATDLLISLQEQEKVDQVVVVEFTPIELDNGNVYVSEYAYTIGSWQNGTFIPAGEKIQ
jgi:coenzyme F420-reducing hydrogenase beta subunit